MRGDGFELAVPFSPFCPFCPFGPFTPCGPPPGQPGSHLKPGDFLLQGMGGGLQVGGGVLELAQRIAGLAGAGVELVHGQMKAAERAGSRARLNRVTRCATDWQKHGRT